MNVNKDAISLNDCEVIIRNFLQSNNYAVINYNVQPFSDTVNGFLGEYLLIKIKILLKQTETEVKFFGKRFPFDHELQKQYALTVEAFNGEIFTYEVLFKEFKKFYGFEAEFAPKYYFGRDNDVIILEDLSVKGFVPPEHPNALSLDHIKLTLNALAQYHAGSIGYQEFKSKETGKKYRLIDEYPIYLKDSLFRKEENFLGYDWCRARLSALIAVIDLLPLQADISPQEFKKRLAQVFENSFEIMKPTDKFCNAVCHGDMWAKNVVFRYENGVPVECKLVDFQLQRYCPPAHDVLHFIYLTTSNEERKHHLHKLLRYYHDCLKKEVAKGNLDIANILPYEDFELSVNYLLPQIKLQTAYYYSFQAGNPEFLKKVMNNPDALKKFMFGDGAPFAVELFKTDTNYKNLMTESLMELKDLVIYSKLQV